MKEYNHAISDAICEYLTEEDWNYEFNEERGIIRSGVTSKSKFQSYKLIFSIHNSSFSFFVYIPISSSDGVRENVAEYIARANYGLIVGGFEMDYTDGEVRYRATHCCGETVPTNEQITHILYSSISTVEKYANGLIAVLFGFASAKDAIELAEKDD